MKTVKIIDICLLFSIFSCKSSSELTFSSEKEIIKLRQHLEKATSINNLHELSDGYFLNKENYVISDISIIEDEFKNLEIQRSLSKIREGEIYGPVENKKGFCSLFKKIKDNIEVNSRIIYLYRDTLRIDTQTPVISIKELLNKIKEGEDFGSLAETYSDDVANRNKKGDLGWLPKTKVPSEFYEVSKDLAENEVFVVNLFNGKIIGKVIKKWKSRKVSTIIKVKIKDCLRS